MRVDISVSIENRNEISIRTIFLILLYEGAIGSTTKNVGKKIFPYFLL